MMQQAEQHCRHWACLRIAACTSPQTYSPIWCRQAKKRVCEGVSVQHCEGIGLSVGGGDGAEQVVVGHVQVGQVGQILHPGAWQAALKAVALQLQADRKM